MVEIRNDRYLTGVVYKRLDGAFDALFWGLSPVDRHRYDAFDSKDEAVAWVFDLTEKNCAER
jgi:hypothetical protein